MNKKSILVFAIILFSAKLIAQYNQLEYGIKTGVGVSWIRVDLDEVSSRPGLNINSTGFVNYFFCENSLDFAHFGLHTGLGVNRYNSILDLGNLSNVFSEGKDPTGDYERILYSHAWQEKVSLTTLSVPLGLIYKTSLTQFLQFNALLGLNIEMPIASSFDREQGSLSTRLYYPEYMKDRSEAIIDAPALCCYEQRTDWNNASGSLAHKLNLSLYLETGMVYRIIKTSSHRDRRLQHKNRRMSLTANLYMGYGLSSLTSKKNTQILFSKDTDCRYYSPTSIASTYSLYTGIKLGLFFGAKKQYYIR